MTIKLIALFSTLLCTASFACGQVDYNLPPVEYQTTETADAGAMLAERIAAGMTVLAHDKDTGYLKSLLDELKIPVSSQTLVFSKTSLQIDKISPRQPRALYFNDDVYVGWCRNGDVIEIAATDAKQGPTFYTLSQKRTANPKLIRDKGKCMSCHQSNRTQNVPGFFMRSVYPGKSGHPDLSRGSFTTDNASPFSVRWGGWYVTGQHGDMRHMGNAIFNKKEPELEQEQLAAGSNRNSVEDLFSTKRYLSTHSDVVALMVLQHQTQMHNAITFANFETRRALHQSYSMNKILERPEGFISDSAKRRINSAAEKVVKHLLMCEEVKLTSPVSGSSNFTVDFEAIGKLDSKGRSLRQFDLKTRLFRFPCSYLIHSESFRGLPDEVRLPVLDRLKEILEGRDTSSDFDHLSVEDRKSVLEILRETKVIASQENESSPLLLEELKSRNDELSFESFLKTSTTEAMAFRNRILQIDDLENSDARLIADACIAFRTGINPRDLEKFELSAAEIEGSIRGNRSIPDPESFYGSFEGKWFGLWEQNQVDHHWSEYTDLGQAIKRFDDVTLHGYQYAWVGDGYALNHVASMKDSEQRFLLGYVVHVKDQDPTREIVRRPHVGVIDGPNRLIWITKSEVFFEEVIPASKARAESYRITGFRYQINRNANTDQPSSLIASKAFQAIYSRDKTRRTPWRGFDIDINVTHTLPESD